MTNESLMLSESYHITVRTEFNIFLVEIPISSHKPIRIRDTFVKTINIDSSSHFLVNIYHILHYLVGPTSCLNVFFFSFPNVII